MPDNWIGMIKLTNETKILHADGTELHDYIPCNQGAAVPVDIVTHPILHSKLTGVPDMTAPAGSPAPYKIIADLTSGEYEPELIRNGTFTNGRNNWTNTNTVLTVTNDVLNIARNSAAYHSHCNQVINTVIGETYKFVGYGITTTKGEIALIVGPNAGNPASDTYSVANRLVEGWLGEETLYTATNVETYVSLLASGFPDANVDIDIISCKKA